MGGRQSTSGGGSLSSTNSPRVLTSTNGGHHSAPGSSALPGGTSSRENGNARNRHLHPNGPTADWRQRARSLTSVMNGHQPAGASNGQPILGVAGVGLSFGLSASPDSDTSSEDVSSFGRVFSAHSLPVQLVPFNGIKCPVCSKTVLPDDVECHLVMCLTKPRISYNEDVLTEDKGECVICLDDLSQGDTIARLPCLCIYHKSCIDAWFEVNRSCPEHPAD